MKKLYLSGPVFLTMLLAACQSTSSPSVENTAEKTTRPAAFTSGHGLSERDREAFISEHAADGSDSLTLEAFIAFRTARFTEGDTDGNGSLNEDEYVDEYATRLERQIEAERKGHAEQTLARFKSLDKDQDNFISRAEYNASGDRAWLHFDKAGTGVVRAADHEQQQPTQRFRSVLGMPTSHNIKGFLELYDESGEGVVTRLDYQRQRDASFDTTDVNGDGKLSLEEYQDEFETRLDRQANRVREAQIKQAHVRFNVLDTDKDKAISLDEYLASGLRTFKRWDTNGDNTISGTDPLPAPRTMPGQHKDNTAHISAQ